MIRTERLELVKKSSGENSPRKHVYNAAIQFSNSKSTVDFRIVSEREKSQQSLINLARQGLAKISGFQDVTQCNGLLREDKICIFCKRGFRAKSDNARYCCMRHRVAAFRRRKKQAKHEG
jgi:hypothetical protein